MEKSRLCILTASCLIAMGAYAAGYRSMVVNLSDGNNVKIELNDELTTRFTSDAMIVSDNKGIDLSFPVSNLKGFNFSEQSGIVSATVGNHEPELSGNTMRFFDLVPGSTLTVHDTAGRALVNLTGLCGEYDLGLDTLPAGTYIVTVNGVSYKIMVK